MWGNYSNLRRTLAQLDSGTAYNDLSPADKTYLQTAACTLGMLAYNIDRVQRFDPRNYQNDAKARPGQAAELMQQLAKDLYSLMDGRVDEANGFYEVLPKSQLSTYNYDNSTPNPDPTKYNPRDYDRVPAEAFLGKLREYVFATTGTPSYNSPEVKTAELIFSYFQIRRDRTYGFRASPAANTWNYNPYVTDLPGNDPSGKGRTNLWSSACDPNLFAFNSPGYARLTGQAGAQAQVGSLYFPEGDRIVPAYRLALSRLCGTVIPSGAERIGSGDTGLPARNSGASGGPPSTTVDTAAIPKQSPSSYTVGAPTAKSPTTFISSGNPLNQAPYVSSTDATYVRATVAPSGHLSTISSQSLTTIKTVRWLEVV